MTRTASRGAERHPEHDGDLVVVDGSNIATEGRSMPSLAQLNEAVLSFREEYSNVNVTVVVDATFGHRIAKSEVSEFDAAVAHNELVAPPAGAVGRGDAFVLSIANKSGARILSNDSFQEFHGTYPWLFDEGRLVGGKPVPHVGWVFVNRLPVKGAVSRKARATTADRSPARRSASKLASEPMPVPTVPPPGPARPPRSTRTKAAPTTVEITVDAAATAKPASSRGGPVNELFPFLDFIQHHPVGSSVSGVVESYSSHGGYVTIGEVRGYVPLRLMGSPPPRSAREVMKQGEAVTLVVDSFAPSRRSIDLALPGTGAIPESPTEAPPRRKKAATVAAPAAEPSAAPAPPKKVAAKKAPAKAANATKKSPVAKKAAPAKKVTEPSAKVAATKKAAATKRAPKKSAAASADDARPAAAGKRSPSGRSRKQAANS